MRKFILALALALAPLGAFADEGSRVQVSGAQVYPTVAFGPAGGATTCATVNTTAANGTVTIPASSLPFYVTGVYVDITEDATGLTGVQTAALAGLAGGTINYSLATVVASTVTSSVRQIAEVYNPPLKGIAGTAITWTPSAQSNHVIFCPRVTGYYAP